MKINIITGIFAVNLFLCMGLFRGRALGQDINLIYIAITFLLSIIFGVWLYLLKIKEKQS